MYDEQLLRDSFENFCRDESLSPRTADFYWLGVKRFARYLDAEGVAFDEATREDVVEWRLSEEGALSNATQSGYLSGIRGFYEWAEAKGYCKDPTRSLRVKKGYKNPRQPLDAAVAKELLDSAKRATNSTRWTLARKRDYAMLCLMFRSLVRESEIVAANVSDYHDSDTDAVLVSHGFGLAKKPSPIYLDEESALALRDYLACRGPVCTHDALFAGTNGNNTGGRLTRQGVRSAVKVALRRVGITSTDFSIGKTALSLAAAEGATDAECREFARLRSWNLAVESERIADRRAGSMHEKIDAALTGENKSQSAKVKASELRAAVKGLGKNAVLTVSIDRDGNLTIDRASS